MKFTNIFKSAALSGVLMSLASVASAQDTITLKYADQFPLTHASSRLASQVFIKELEERSEGRIKVQHFPAEQIAKGAGLLDAARNRVTDFAFIIPNYNTDKLPLTSVGELPGLYTESVAASEAFETFATEQLQESEYLPLGVRLLWATVTPPYQVMFGKGDSSGDITNLDGAKLRVPGATGELIVKALGGVPVKVPASDLYLALQRGTVDGALYNAPSIFAYKIEEVTSKISRNGSLGAVTTALLINEDVWQSLSAENQALIQQVATDVRRQYAQDYQASTDEAYGKLEEAGVEVFEMSTETQESLAASLSTVRDEWVSQVGGRGLPAQEMLDSFIGYLAK